ncbi:MAG: glycosyl transferase family 28, partial [Acidimicrobiales bacterium]|nr:glycosyl transferase family 28 [Acidimicrobiales bacterium]
LVQHGTSRAPGVARGAVMFGWREMRDLMAEAAAVVCAGGPGTIMDAREEGKLPIVVPRHHDLGEHVDDHQRAFARFLATHDLAHVVETQTDLESLLGRLHVDADAFGFDPSTRPMPEGVGRFAQVVDDLVRGPS